MIFPQRPALLAMLHRSPEASREGRRFPDNYRDRGRNVRIHRCILQHIVTQFLSFFFFYFFYFWTERHGAGDAATSKSRSLSIDVPLRE